MPFIKTHEDLNAKNITITKNATIDDLIIINKLTFGGVVITSDDFKGNGIQGPPGIQGPSGTPGIQGLSGTPGIQGLSGTPGTQGLSGIQGPSGAPGIQGPSGTPGTQGEQGIQGPSGTPGTQGEQGIQGIPGNSNSSFSNGISFPNTDSRGDYTIKVSEPILGNDSLIIAKDGKPLLSISNDSASLTEGPSTEILTIDSPVIIKNNLNVFGSITIGTTIISESQLIKLIQLIN